MSLFETFGVAPALFASNCRAVEEPFDAYLRVPRMILPNAVDIEVFQPRSAEMACRQLGLDVKRPRVALAIRPSADKGLTFLYEVARRARIAQPNVEFVIAGDYPDRQHYAAEVEQLGLANAIRFLGHLDDVAGLYAASNVVLLTSPQDSIEGSPNALLEAMACARPVVATAVGGVPELFRDGLEGYLIPVTEPESAADTIALLLSDSRRCEAMGSAGRKRATRDHVPVDIAKRLVSRISRCIRPDSHLES